MHDGGERVKSTKLQEFQSCLSALTDSFLSDSDSAPRALPFSSSQGPVRKKTAGQRIWAADDKRAHIGSMPAWLAITTERAFACPLHPAWSVPPLRLRATLSRSVWMTMNWMTAFLRQLQMQKSYRALWLNLPSFCHLLHARLRADEELIRVTTKAVNELRLEWSLPEEPSRSRLDEWFLPRRHQALRQCLSPFVPEVHDELTKLCRVWTCGGLSWMLHRSSEVVSGNATLPP